MWELACGYQARQMPAYTELVIIANCSNRVAKNLKPTMKNYGQAFLDTLANLSPDTFESRFSRTSTRLGLAAALNRNELTLLYEAAFRAELCHVALNGLGQPDGRIKPEDEANRIKRETEFLTARDIFYASPGWQTLAAPQQGPIKRIFLSVVVAEGKLAR